MKDVWDGLLDVFVALVFLGWELTKTVVKIALVVAAVWVVWNGIGFVWNFLNGLAGIS